jgi:TonB family protein
MRRPLHIAVALAALALGLLVAGAPAQLPYALPAAGLAALLLPALWERVRRPAFDAHRLKVAAITLLLWAALFAFFYAQLQTPSFGSCVLSFEGDDSPGVEAERSEPSDVPAPAVAEEPGGPCYPGATNVVDGRTNLIWAGVIDKKALSKPQPFYPPAARAAYASGTIEVLVLVDEAGLVLSARPLAGHPLLGREAARAACFARFHPAHINGPPVRVSGVLTYRFGT